jgi:hypothetical protein
MKLDISVVVAQLVIFLQDQGSYKDFLAYRGTDAQGLLDFLQDVSTSRPIHMPFPTKQPVSGS